LRQIKKFGFITVIAAIFLASCTRGGQSPRDLVEEIRADILESSRLIINAQITADYGDRVYEFGVRYTGGADLSEIVILSPELIAGITAEVTPGGAALIFDGARLDTGPLTGGGLTPVEALPALISGWRSGVIASVGFERFGETDTVVFETAADDFVTQRTWFDRRTLLPLRSEIVSNGVLVITAVFNNVVIE